MSDKNLYTYSFIKSLYDQSRDYLDALSPLVYQAVPTDRFVDITSIQADLKKNHGLEFPLHLVKTLVATGKRKDLVRSNGDQQHFQLTDDGHKLVQKIESKSEVTRRINALVADIFSEQRSKGGTRNIQEVSAALTAFIENNLGSLVDVFSSESGPRETTMDRAEEAFLVSYLQNAKESKPEHFKTLKELIHGSVIASLVYTKNVADLTELGSMHFKGARLYLDSNIILSVLGFHTEEMRKAATELLDLIRKHKFELWAFEFTVDEICRLLHSYPTVKNKFPTAIPIDSLFSVFRRQGLNTSDLVEIIDDIDARLLKIGIRVDPTPDVNLKDYESDNEALRGQIASYKADKPLTSINHDLAAVDYIRKQRGRSVRKIEDPRALFLTADNSLHRVALNAFDHVESGTLSEVMLDRIFANIIWLKCPDIDVPIDLLIASHSRGLLIDRYVWDRFYTVLSRLRSEGTVTDDRAAALFYRNQISDILKNISRSDASKIDEAFVAAEIETAARKVEAEHATLEEEKELLKNELFVTAGESEKSQQLLLQQTTAIHKALRKQAHATAFKFGLVFTFFTSMLLAIVEGELVYYFHNNGMDVNEILFGLIFGGGFIVMIPANYQASKYISGRVTEYLSIRFFKKAKREIFEGVASDI